MKYKMRIPAALVLILAAVCHATAEEPLELQKALALRNEGKNGQAADELKRCTALWPEHVRAYVHLGASLEDQGNWKDAANAYRRALEIDPGNAAASRNLEQLMSSRTLDYPLPTKKAFREELVTRGLLALQRKDYAKSLEVFRLLRGLSPDDPRPLFYSAVALERQGKTLHAVALYERIAESFPDYAPARINLVITLVEAGDRDGAALQARKALAVLPENRRLKYLVGMVEQSRQADSQRRIQEP